MSLLTGKETNAGLREIRVQRCRHSHLCWGSAIVGGSNHLDCLGSLLTCAGIYSRRGNLTGTVKGIRLLFNSEAPWLAGEPVPRHKI